MQCKSELSASRIVLELADLPEPPAPAAGQVLIGVEHAPITMNDLYLIRLTAIISVHVNSQPVPSALDTHA